MRPLLLVKRSVQRAVVSGRINFVSTAAFQPHRASIGLPLFARSRTGVASLVAPRRHFSKESGGFFSGIRDKISGKMENRQDKLEKDNFDVYMKELLKMKKHI